jgi:hypothetical protein
VEKLTTFEGRMVKSLLLQATRCAVGGASEIIGGVTAMSTGVTRTRIAVADHRPIGAEVRQRNSDKPSQQGNITEIGQGIEKGGEGRSSRFDKMVKPPQLKQFRVIVGDYLTLKARYIGSQK